MLGFLALIALGTATAPLVFDVDGTVHRVFHAVEWVVVAVFAVDYLRRLVEARGRWRWAIHPWQLVELAAIVIPLLTLVPAVDDSLRGTAGLRLLLVGGAVAFGTRAGMAAVVPRSGRRMTGGSASTRVLRVPAEHGEPVESASWNEVVEWGGTPTDRWYHATNAGASQLGSLAASLKLAPNDLRALFDPTAGARSRRTPNATFLVITLPKVAMEGFPEISWTRVVVVLPPSGVLTATETDADLPALLTASPGLAVVGHQPFGPRTFLRLLELARDRYLAFSQRFVDELEGLEEMPLLEGGTDFLAKVFRLRREIAAAGAELYRVGTILRHLAEGHLPMPGATPETLAALHAAEEQSQSLLKHFGDLRDELQSLLDLHLNVKSYQMNTFMRFLAVVSFLGLIPAVTGGLLGMNIAGQPWGVTLGQTTFLVALGMIVSIYLFAIRGWLR